MEILTVVGSFFVFLQLLPLGVVAFTGGTNATSKDIREIVSLRNILKDAQLFGSGHYCGATIYSVSTFLTAASCLSDTIGDKFMLPGFIRIIGGTLDKDLMTERTYTANGDKIKPHPGYNFRRRAHNIAFIKVTAPITEKKFNLKVAEMGKKNPKVGDKCEIIGWGRVSQGPNEPVFGMPQKAKVEMLKMDSCRKVHRDIPDGTLCFGGIGVSVCLEDTGTPVFCRNRTVGVITLVGDCIVNNHTHPFVVTSVPDFMDWILLNGSAKALGVSIILIPLGILMMLRM